VKGPLDARRTVPTAGTYAALAAGVVAFTLYGSFVPFDFRWRPPDEAAGAWDWVLAHRIGIASRSDFAANVLLAFPLGFCLLGALRVDRPGVRAAALTGLAVWPACVLFAAAVEFAQLYFPGRTASGSDVIAQAVGSAAGIVGWLLAGPRVTRWARRVWAGQRIGGAAGRMLVGYLALLALVQLLPLDLSASPADLYRKLRDKVSFVPFEGATGVRLQSWLVLACLYFPAGLLAARRDEPFWRRWDSAPRVFGLGLLLAFGLESLQLIVASRSPAVTDVLVGGAAVLIGWVVGRLFPATGRGLSMESAVGLALAWVGVLLLTTWPPFDFDSTIVGERFDRLNWVPFAGAAEKDYLGSLEEALTKIILFAPLGALVAGAGSRPAAWKRRAAAAAAVGAAVAGLIEAGQLILPDRFPSPTDVIFGAAGGWLGAAVAVKLRSPTWG
jgi:VanZ family protein